MSSTPFVESGGQPVLGDVRARVAAARELLAGVAGRVVEVGSGELASLAAEAAALVAAAEAVRASLVLESAARGVIAESDHPRVDRWVEQSCVDAGVPVVRSQARQLHELAATAQGCDVEELRVAVVAGRVSAESAALVARVFRRLKKQCEHGDWDALLRILIDEAASGAGAKRFEEIAGLMIGQYGLPGLLDDEQARLYARRELSTFRRDRSGMLAATLLLDPGSEASFTAAIHALSAPRPAEDGSLDERAPGARRADALLRLAALATSPDREVPGSGNAATVVVTIPLESLTSGLAEAGEERGCGTTAFGQVLSPTRTRMLACDAQIVPAVLGSRGELLDLGRARRLITPGQRRALHERDRGCTFPGCSVPPAWCDGHHLVYWALGGPTDMSNLGLLCRHHHTQVHRRRHRGRVGPDGRVRWTRADGGPIGNTPYALVS